MPEVAEAPKDVQIVDKAPIKPLIVAPSEISTSSSPKNQQLIDRVEEYLKQNKNPMEALRIIAETKTQSQVEQVGQDSGQPEDEVKTRFMAESIKSLFTLRRIGEIFKDPRVTEVLPGVVAAGVGVLAGANLDALSNLSQIDPHTLSRLLAMVGGGAAGHTLKPFSGRLNENDSGIKRVAAKAADIALGAAVGVDVAAAGGVVMSEGAVAGTLGSADDLLPVVPSIVRVARKASSVVSSKLTTLLPKPKDNTI